MKTVFVRLPVAADLHFRREDDLVLPVGAVPSHCRPNAVPTHYRPPGLLSDVVRLYGHPRDIPDAPHRRHFPEDVHPILKTDNDRIKGRLHLQEREDLIKEHKDVRRHRQ